MNENNPHWGASLDDFLNKNAVREQARATALIPIRIDVDSSKKTKGFHPLDPRPACRRRQKRCAAQKSLCRAALLTPAARRSGSRGPSPPPSLDVSVSTRVGITRVVAWQLSQEKQRQGITKARRAELMQTSRAQVDRILQAKGNVTVETRNAPLPWSAASCGSN